MKNIVKSFSIGISILVLIGCSGKTINLSEENISVINREVLSINKEQNAIALNSVEGVGLVKIEDVAFKSGIIELEIKGENTPGRSFVGIAFNVQNDSTYEAVYFRPFNFQSEEKIRREHSVQYISTPKNDWRYLRTNFEGVYEAEYPGNPPAEDWLSVKVKVESDMVYVYDKELNVEIMSVERLERQQVNKIALWTGFNSKGEFRNLKVVSE